jgi:hypothetical protein
VQSQNHVLAVPSALSDRNWIRATGAPSNIQVG